LFAPVTGSNSLAHPGGDTGTVAGLEVSGGRPRFRYAVVSESERHKAMTISEKTEMLFAIRRRFDSGAWDDLDVKLLLSLSLIAVESDWMPDEIRVEEAVDEVEGFRSQRANLRLEAHKRSGR
jgi:hypothetical protein